MKTMIESERQYMQLREKKKKKAFEDMKVQICLKEEKKKEEEELKKR